MFHRNNPKYTSNSTSTLLKNEQAIAQERVCIYSVIQSGNKARLSLMLFTHQWEQIPLLCRVFPLFIQREEKHPALLPPRRGSPWGDPQVPLLPGEWAHQGRCLFEPRSKFIFRSRNSKKKTCFPLCRWGFFNAEKLLQSKTAGEPKAFLLSVEGVLLGQCFCQQVVRRQCPCQELWLNYCSEFRPVFEHS